MTMSECSKRDSNDAMSNPKSYCFGCLCDNNEKQVRSFAFVYGPLRELFQMESINLCYICKRIAQHTEMFIQSVHINQILMENFSTATDETLKSVKLQTQPLINLKQVTYEVIESSENDAKNMEESFCVLNNVQKGDVKVKIELKEETELLENLEAEFINEDDEFPEMYVKGEEDFPITTMVKEEIGSESTDTLNLLKPRPTKKKKLKKKIEDKRSIEMPEVKTIYITKTQCMEERTRLSKDEQYVGSQFKCSNCIKGFNHEGSYDTHMEKHNESNGDFECDICKQRMDSEDKLVSHMRYHFIRYKCPICGITRHCRKTIKEHYSVYHLGAKHSCQECYKVFKRKNSLRRHVVVRHARRERASCAHCARSYVDKDALRAHIVQKHTKAVSAVEVLKKYVCPECGMRYKTPSQLRNHSIKHSDIRKFYCVECDKSFKSEGILKTHLKTAAIHCNYKELPLSCLHCEKRFANRRDVEQHTNRVHLNVKPYRCDRCDKAYVNSWALKDHKRYTHEGYKRPLQYQCTMCDKAFDRNQILKSHIRTHTGERPYQCPKCPAQFSQASILRTHDRLIHLKLTRDGKPKMGAMK